MIGLRGKIFLLNGHRRANCHNIAVLFLDDHCAAQGSFNFLKATFEKSLVHLGLMIISVFREVAHLDGGPQTLRQLLAAATCKFCQLCFEFGFAFRREICWMSHYATPDLRLFQWSEEFLMLFDGITICHACNVITYRSLKPAFVNYFLCRGWQHGWF